MGCPGLLGECHVSIHAPARGATKDSVTAWYLVLVSIHAPARGATKHAIIFRPPTQFQSTPPRGGRRSGTRRSSRRRCFNPRPRAGGDTRRHRSRRSAMFQSTPPRGGRRPRPARRAPRIWFQSTPPRGGRQHIPQPRGKGGVSIHAPARGATQARHQRVVEGMFQSTPPRGGRHHRRVRLRQLQGFNPRPRAGGDRLNSTTCALDKYETSSANICLFEHHMTLYRHEDLHNPLNTSRLHRLRTSRYNYVRSRFALNNKRPL